MIQREWNKGFTQDGIENERLRNKEELVTGSDDMSDVL